MRRCLSIGNVSLILLVASQFCLIGHAAESPNTSSPNVLNKTTESTQNQANAINYHHPASKCQFKENDKDDWIDNVRKSTHGRLCKSAFWLDSKFGDEYQFDYSNFRGKLVVGFRQDESDGFDPRVRVKLRTKLPNLSSRLNAFVGRVDEDSYISNTERNTGQLDAIGLRSNDDDDADWLVGLGYRNPESWENGFDYSVGLKVSSGVRPYAKITHRHLFALGENSYLKATQTGFWRRKDGTGFSSSLDYTYVASEADIMEWDMSAKYTENAEQWEWFGSTSWHHSLSEKRGISSKAYVRGEQKNDVSIPEFGVSFTYVRPFLKPWLMIETGIDFRWEKHNPHGDYQSISRLGIQLEMLLGDYYGGGRKSSIKTSRYKRKVNGGR